MGGNRPGDLSGTHRINARSKLWKSTAKSFLKANREENHEYRDSAPCTSVVYHNQLWSFVSVVLVLYASTRLDVSASRQMVSSFSEPV